MIFVDTSFWVALGNAADKWHDTAKRLWADKPPVVVTSNYVLGETWTLLNRRCGRQVAATAAALRRSASVRVEHIAADLEEEAWQWLLRHGGRKHSFVDAASFDAQEEDPQRLRVRRRLRRGRFRRAAAMNSKARLRPVHLSGAIGTVARHGCRSGR